jgi:uncharacterized damage-inducible protein DinB
MNDWDDLLLTGGFAPRESIFSGLTLEQVAARPNEVPHSIYQELWHATMVLKISLDEGRFALESWPYEEHFPVSFAPTSQQEWDDLVSMFMKYSKRAVTLSEDTSWLDAPEPGYPQSNWRNALAFLAVHTAYHMGKVISLRQVMKIWKQ